MTNLSARTRTGAGGDVLIAGFVIAGAAPKRLLIRAIGPSLAPFGVTGTLADPRLQLFSGGTLLAENDNWDGIPAIVGAFASAGAFALTADSEDAALVISLQPGVYTAQISGGTGVVLVEIYDLDP